MIIDEAKGALSVDSGAFHAVKEELPSGVMGATKSGEDSAGIQHSKGAEVKFLIAPHGVFDGFLIPGKGGRIENDEVVGFLMLAEEVEGIGGDGFDRDSGECGIFFGGRSGFFRNVDGGDGFSTSKGTGEAESTLVAEDIENFLAGRQLGDTFVAIHDVEIETGLLTIGGIDFEDRILVVYGKGLGLFTVNHRDLFIETFGEAHGRIISERDGLWIEQFDEGIDDEIFSLIHSQRGSLKDHVLFVLIDDDAWEAI